MNRGRIDDCMREAVGPVFPGAVLLVRQGDRILHHEAYGQRSVVPARLPMTKRTSFDLSSLTKPLATTTMVMRLVADGRLSIEDPVATWTDAYAEGTKRAVTIRHLLSHSSGLPAWRPFYEGVKSAAADGSMAVASEEARAHVLREAMSVPLESNPGERAVYSDIGFMILGFIVEQVAQERLDRLYATRVATPLGLPSMRFPGVTADRTISVAHVDPSEIAATEDCPWRATIVCGEVHDDNAWAMGGVAGHAGLFGPAIDIDRCLVQLRACFEGRDEFLPEAVLRRFWTRDEAVPGSVWSLGWDGPAEAGSSAGRHFSRRTVGHLGYTGTSIWLDLERDCHVILLSNRVHPHRRNDAIRAFRPRIHDIVNEELLGAGRR